MKNFVTSDAFISIELNVWSLLKLLIRCRDKYGKEYFLVHLMSSQTCENFFRLLRSLTATFCTQVNFNVLELLERIHKLQLMEEIRTDLKDIFVFPEEKPFEYESNKITYDLPADHELQEAIDKAYKEAVDVAKKLQIWSPDINKINIYLQNETEINFSVELPKSADKRRYAFEGIEFVDEVSGNLYSFN
jgi:hypothetical protein